MNEVFEYQCGSAMKALDGRKHRPAEHRHHQQGGSLAFFNGPNPSMANENILDHNHRAKIPMPKMAPFGSVAGGDKTSHKQPDN